MGVVYRAHDIKLQRSVALKLLPDHFAHDADRLSRFQREAQILASLNHPNIAQIYGLEEADKTCCIVMELVEGETLQERLRRGEIPLDEALPIAKQIAEALEAAHEKGIIHRDLKPGNLKLTIDGKVKVLDFGLAKVFHERPATTLSNSPTLIGESVPGVILGTAAYMSPEQAKGKDADRTSDVWAFGCVLYEMLTGHAAFGGETVSEVIAALMKEEPSWARLPRQTPLAIRRLMRRCFEKDSKQRLQHLGDARLEIDDVVNGSQTDIQAAPIASRRRERLAWILGLMFVTVVAAVAIVQPFRPVTVPSEIRLEISTPPTSDPISLAISPDGQKIVFVATADNHSELWLRSLNSVSTRPLMGTDGGIYPFWSPDSRSIGFFADGKLKRIDIDEASIQTLADAPDSRGGAWCSDGAVIFSPTGNSGPLFRVSATGGDTSPLTGLEPQQTNHRFPQLLPDGRHFLYYAQGSPQSRGIFISRLDGSEPRRLVDADSTAVYASSGQLFFVRQATLFAQDFDMARLELTGNPFPVAEHIARSVIAQGGAALSTSRAGPIVYRTASAGGLRQLTWFDRSGKQIGNAADPFAGLSPSISPDGRRVALMQASDGNFDIWLLDLGPRVLSRFTLDPAVENMPTWSPDSRSVLFGSNRNGVFDLYVKPATGGGTETLLLTTTQSKDQSDWSPDGKFVLFRSLDPKTSYDIWAVPLDGDRKPFPVVKTNYNERDGQFSPDGKWIAYQSNESGRFEIYVQPFPGPGGKWQVSTNGGAQVRWRRDGKELFYIALDGRLMAVPIQLSSNAQSVDANAPVPLFATHVGGAVQNPFTQQYAVAADGQRFLMNNVLEEAIATPITVILNWKGRPRTP